MCLMCMPPCLVVTQYRSVGEVVGGIGIILSPGQSTGGRGLPCKNDAKI